MTFLNLSMAVVLLTAAEKPPDCSLPQKSSPGTWAFTNADLDRMAACRRQAGDTPEVSISNPERSAHPSRASKPLTPSPGSDGALEADWRARWRSVDQRVRKLREEARELRQEASVAPRDPKKQATGRRSPSLLLSRATRLESEARRIEEEFEGIARREGALPGWLRER